MKLKFVFKSTLLFEDSQQADVLLVYCSDFRFRKHFWEFQEKVLGNKKIDRMIQPGGHLQLFANSLGYPNADAAEKFWLEFLAANHQVKEVVFVGHARCAAYAGAKKLANKSPDDLRKAQINDLLKARDLVLSWHKKLKVKLYFAEPARAGRGVIFSQVTA